MVKITKEKDTLFVAWEAPALDANNCTEFQSKVRAEMGQIRALEIDLGQLRFIDSSGIGALVAIQNQFGAARGKICLRNVNPAIRDLLAMLHLKDIFTFA